MAEPLVELAPADARPTDERLDGLDRIGHALADPTRRRILVLMLDHPQRPSDLADAVGTSRSNLSNHLTCLRGCGLVSAQRSGRHLHYSLVSDAFGDALQLLLTVATTLPHCDDHQQALPSSPHAGAAP